MGTMAWLTTGKTSPNTRATRATYPVNFRRRRLRNCSSMAKVYQKPNVMSHAAQRLAQSEFANMATLGDEHTVL